MADTYRTDLPIYGLESDERHDGVILLSHSDDEKTTAQAWSDGWLMRDWEIVDNEQGWMCVASHGISADEVAKLYAAQANG